MCGIAGLMVRDAAAGGRSCGPLLDRFAAALAHRGPDGEGRHVSGRVAMVQRRLAIIDLATGDQPLYADAKDGRRIALVANGEIYNYVELRKSLGGPFATQSDCEPPLKLYLKDGERFADSLRGMYAIALHDPGDDKHPERLLLARDPFGIKPLYYAETHLGVAFASEPQALIAGGIVPARVHAPVRASFFAHQFAAGEETIFAGIRRVRPGETLVIEAGRIVRRLLRPALPAGGPLALDATEAEERLDAVLRGSVAVHQRSDVPYGLFLSGGIDSSAVLALMRDLNDEPVRAFSIGFPGTRAADERAQAKRVAAEAGAVFESVSYTKNDFWHDLPKLAAALDDPVADYAALPTFRLARLARAEGIKVVLTGEGGDELFAGYGRYRRALRPRILGGRAMRARGIFDGLGVLHETVRPSKGTQAAHDGHGRTRLQDLQATDIAGWLPDDLLIKLDRCLMTFGAEGRTPFLDPEVAALAFLLPDRLKLKGGRGKWLLRRWLSRQLSAAEPLAAKKGFTVPVADWIGEKGGRLGSLVAAAPGILETCRPDAVRKLFAHPEGRAAEACWILLFYALWHRRHILGMMPGDDVFDTLAAR